MNRGRDIESAPSLWDRLTNEQERPATLTDSLRVLKESIRRDLEELLNTRRPLLRELQAFPLARVSVVNFGLEDLSNLSHSAIANTVQGAVQCCLMQYEPRLREVKVSLLSVQPGRREIILHIEAILPVQSAIENILFDTTLDLVSGMYAVR